jgi:malonate decarboxylase delta subunit
METLQLDYPAGVSGSGRALAGVVGSGDLEVLIEPAPAGTTFVVVHSSVDGSAAVWRAQLDRLFGAADAPALRIEIHDFGATPGVVSLRLSQALEQLQEAR